MKIAFIVGAFPTLSETFILNQITGLLDLGQEVDIFAHYNPDMDKIHPDVEAYRLMERTYYFNMPTNKVKRVLKAMRLVVANLHKAPLRLLEALNIFKLGKEALSLRSLYSLIPFLGKEQGYDIIHCHFGPNGNIGVLLNELGIGGKVITSFYGYDISAHVEQFSGRIYDPLFHQGDLFIAISDTIIERLIRLGCSKDKVVKHPLGVDVEEFHCEGRNRQIGEEVKILTVARLVEKKGLGYSIKAFAKVVKKYLDVEYYIAGDGPLKGHLELLISELGVKGQVRLLGWQDQEQLRRLYQYSHIFMLASVTARDGDQEGTPTVLMEAQAQGLPVISTLHSGIPEIVLDGQSGLLVPERDAGALAERLEYLIEHPEIWPAMGRAGRRFVEEHHDIRKLNRRLVEIYETLLAGRPSNPTCQLRENEGRRRWAGRAKNPTVSVIIPTYNRAHLLGRAIQSVLNQTYQDFELIVVDDGSSDNTGEVVATFADSRIHYLRHEENRGAAAARNTAIKTAQGRYIAFLDSDDEWLPEKLEKQMKVFGNVSSRVGVVYTDMWRIGQDGVRKYWHSSRIMPEDGLIYDHLIGGRLTGISMSSVIIRRGCFAKVGMFDEELSRLIDRDLFIRLSKHFYFYHIAEALVNYYETGKRISCDDKLLIGAQRSILQKYYADIRKNRRALAQHQYVIGNLLCQNGEIDQGRHHLLEAVRLHPLGIRYLTAAILSLFGERAYNTVVKLKRRIQPLPGP